MRCQFGDASWVWFKQIIQSLGLQDAGGPLPPASPQWFAFLKGMSSPFNLYETEMATPYIFCDLSLDQTHRFDQTH